MATYFNFVNYDFRSDLKNFSISITLKYVCPLLLKISGYAPALIVTFPNPTQFPLQHLKV